MVQINSNWVFKVELLPWRLTAGTCPHGGLVQMIFLSNWVICRFQPFIFQGVPTSLKEISPIPIPGGSHPPRQEQRKELEKAIADVGCAVGI